MVGLTYAPSELEVGMAMAREPESITQATGLGGLAPSAADVAALRQQTVASMGDVAKTFTPKTPIKGAAGAPAAQPTILYDPGTNRMFAGGQVFDAADVQSALGAYQNLDVAAAPPQGFTGRPLSRRGYEQYIEGLRAPRSVTEKLALGGRATAEGIVGGIGRGLEIAGATETGPAIAQFAERTFGQTPFEQQRSALIQQSNTLTSNFFDAVIESVPSVAVSLAAGVGGALGAGAAATRLGAAASTVARARDIGALGSVASTVFPSELKGLYDAAEKNGYNVRDPGVQSEMLAAAAASTLFQTVAEGGIARGFSKFFTDEVGTIARTATRNAVRAGAVSAVGEGFAEGMATLIERATFDPEVRKQLNSTDLKALAPYILNQYGADIAMSAGVGAFLGGGLGGLANFRATQPIDLTQVPPPAEEAPAATAPAEVGPTLGLPAPTPMLALPAPGLPGVAAPEVVVTPPPAPAPQAAPAPMLALPAPALVTPPPTQTFIPPAPETVPGAPRLTQPIPQVVFPEATPEQRAAAFEAAGREAPAPQGPMAPAMQRLLRGKEFTEAQRQRAAAMETVPTAAEAAAPAMQTEVALAEPTVLDTEGASTGRNKLQDDGRRRIIAGFNNLTAAQQDAILAEFDNDVTKFFDYLKRTPPARARQFLAGTAGVDAKAFEVRTPAAAMAQPTGALDATQVGQVEQGRVGERVGADEGLPQEGVNRLKQAAQRGGRAEAGGRNRLVQGRAQPEQVTEAAPVVAPTAPAEAVPPAKKSEGAEAPAPSPVPQPSAKRIVDPEATRADLTEAPPQSDYEEVRSLILELENETDPLIISDAMSALEDWARDNDSKQARDLAREYLSLKTPGKFSLADWNTTDNVADAVSGKPITAPFPVGRVRTVVSAFISRLAKAPRVRIFRDQADLKRRDPALYARAASARAEGDFDTAMAAGYSFGGNEVLIFSDRIVNEQHLRFVLAHEALGHYGMRALLPQNEFNRLMDGLYETDSRARDAADIAMNIRGMSKQEAVEEYLSDYAAILDKSLVLRVWNAIKGALNRIGIKFGDEATRYFLDQARRYVRTGQTSSVFDAGAIAQRLHDMESSSLGTGRFARLGEFVGDNEKAGLMFNSSMAWPTSITEAWQQVRGTGVDTVDGWDKFKAKFLSLLNYRSLQNPGLQEFDRLLGETSSVSMQLKVQMNELLRSVYDSTDETKVQLSKALYAARSLAASKLTRLSDLGRTPLFTVNDQGEFVLNAGEARRLIDQGSITFEQMRDGFSWDVTYEGLDGKPVTEKRSFEGIKGLKKTDPEWTGYLKVREAMAEIELRLLRARYADEVGERQLTYKELGALMSDRALTTSEQAFIDKVLKTYKDLYTKNITTDERGYPVLDPDAMARGNDFIAAVNAAVIGRDTDRNAKVAEFFASDAEKQEVIGQIEAFKTRLVDTAEDRFLLQNKVKQLVLSELSNNDAELYTKRTLATGYIPVLREGQFEVRVEAVDVATGKRVTLKDSHKQLLTYSQFANDSDARSMAANVDAVFQTDGKRTEYEVLAFDEATRQYVPKKVQLFARSGAALEEVAVAPELNLNDFIRGLRQFDINITPAKMERLVVSLTRQNAAARNRLEFSGTPGYDTTQGIVALSRHIESRASTTAKTQTRSRFRELMNLNLPSSQRVWNGDVEKVIRLREAYDAITAQADASREQVVLARQEFEKALYMYRTTNPAQGGWDGRRDTLQAFGMAGGPSDRGMQYYNEAARTLSFLDGNRFVDESDFGSGKVASAVRGYTSMLQLGGSLAQGALNFLSIGSNWVPYMASYNAKNGFGGGFSLGKTLAEFNKAMMQIGGGGLNPLSKRGRELNTAEFYDAMAADPKLLAQYGMKAHEARFIAREIREGVMIPALSNALIGTARGRMTNRFERRFVDMFMAPFNLSEQATRRSAGLAAFRLAYARAMASGKTEAEAARVAREFAVDSINLTLGEYSVTNRPPAWRDGIQSFLYMYKVYPTTTVQLFSNLSRNGKIGMLTALWALAGAAGWPFAEDLEDLIDTLGQALGWKVGSVRAEISKAVESVFPGMSDLFLKGLVHSVLPIPADIASRTSAGDLIPGTGVLLAGANVAQELKDIAGPAAGMLLGAAETAKNLITVPFSEKRSLQDVMRASPVTAMRLFGDVWAYTEAGAVVDRRGYVVSPQMDAATVITRLMGFYPAPAADQYEMIRLTNRIVNYQKDVALGYRQAWVRAMIAGDRAEAQQIERAVESWNRGTRGTALEIRNFVPGSQRALREASRPAGERALRAAPKAAQQELRGLQRTMTAEDDLKALLSTMTN